MLLVELLHGAKSIDYQQKEMYGVGSLTIKRLSSFTYGRELSKAKMRR